MMALIDDLEDNDHIILTNEMRKGYWYPFDDMTGGTITVTPVDGVPGTGGVLTASASGFTEWGAGFGVSLNNDDTTGAPCPYDASVYDGVRFDITTRSKSPLVIDVEYMLPP